ncbi:hypothetical protein [Hirschia litorea]|uniref:Uncharacterized protein n=1 Tax=Hirschia litorea TaxID=1199156 RepID=A0ABW2IIH2_9PROT
MTISSIVSSTLKPSNLTIAALIAIALLFNYLASHFVAIQSSQLTARASIEAELLELDWDQPKSERDVQSVIQWINSKASQQSFPAEKIYFLTDSNKNPLAGNLNMWPQNAQPYPGWHKFEGNETNATSGPVYARIFSGSLEDSEATYKIMVGRQMPAIEPIFRRIFPVFLAISLLCATCGGFIFKAQQSNTKFSGVK